MQISKIGFTHQQLATYALQQEEDLHHQYVEVSLYAQDMLIFIDETGTNCTDTVRKVGYSLRGKPIRAQKLVVCGEHVLAIAAISTGGLLALKIVQGGGVDGDMFYDFVCTELLPKLMPFNGSNHNSVLLLDNCSIHHVPELQQVFRDAQVLTQYLPPYSPDYNPIELAFSKVKYLLKAM